MQEGRNDLYPTFQLGADALPLPAIAKVLAEVPKNLDGWSLLSWFMSSNVLLDGQRPADMVATNPDIVVDAARRFYARD